MKKVSIFDDVHKDVKVEAAKEDTSVPNMASELLRWALKEVRAGRCKLAGILKPATSRK
jgi:hypothetical protein